MTPARRTCRLGAAGVSLALAACGESRVAEPRPPEPNTPERSWTFVQYPGDGGPPVTADSGSQTGGEVHAFHQFGFDRLSVDGGRIAFGEVFSSPDGKT